MTATPVPVPFADQTLTELWTSFASVLRSYCAAHGLNSTNQAVVEVSADSITIRVAEHWTRINQTYGCGTVIFDQGEAQSFALNEDGTVKIGTHPPEDMDHAAERIAREILSVKPPTKGAAA
jgi:hypothetical protein